MVQADKVFWPAIANFHGDRLAKIGAVDRILGLELDISQGDRVSRVRHVVQNEKADATKTLAPAVLFIGCRSSTLDRLDAWAEEGAIDLRYAFSRRV